MKSFDILGSFQVENSKPLLEDRLRLQSSARRKSIREVGREGAVASFVKQERLMVLVLHAQKRANGLPVTFDI